ncbi:MAG TPA: Stp1/IreP family PP2C-type Ser/Thr phosphatase [Candidatus Dormibacteraeota bacterium]|nr:Stp1/IreP family PP2C-type Ser/Thr phosphatase [Candidatus Dormibacteraeota bacterium]
MATEIEFGAQTDIGCVRESNEDSYGAAPELNLFVLSDGMGGLACGEVASRMAVQMIVAKSRAGISGSSAASNGGSAGGVSAESNRLAAAVRAANEAIYRAAQSNENSQPMGATVVAVRFVGERMSLAHVGDSRAYRMRAGQIEQLTRDHSFVAEQVRQGRMTEQEAASSGLQNVLIRALGTSAEVEVDVSEELVLEGDTVLLCSDGLTRELADAQIAAVLGECGEAQEAAERLVNLAKQAGGGDNITAIVLRRAAKSARAFARMRGIGKWLNGSRN